MKKLMAIIMAGVMLFSLTACGGGGGGNADASFEGKYISVAGEMMGMVMTGEDIDGFDIDLKSGGKGTMTVEGDSANIKWSNEGDVLTFKVEGEEIVGAYSEDTIVVDDFLGMGMKLTFAREGSAAADPGLYISETDKAMVGAWKSFEVTDVLGDDASAEMDPAGLILTLNSDYTASGELIGVDLELENYKWSSLDTWGSFDDAEGCVISSWTLMEDGNLEVTYDDGENYYLFICAK